MFGRETFKPELPPGKEGAPDRGNIRRDGGDLDEEERKELARRLREELERERKGE
jgi:hypothetical protein